MSALPNGGPAFPRTTESTVDRDVTDHGGHNGMTLRDYFAAQSLPTIIHLTQCNDGSWDPVAVAAGAYAVADAMLEERAA